MIQIACEIYSRVSGYYRPVNQFNVGKQAEFKERKMLDVEKSCKKAESKVDNK